jgi:hypothetical protein
MSRDTGKRIIEVHLETPHGAPEHHHHITRVRWTRAPEREVSREDVVAAIKRGESVYVEVSGDIADVTTEHVNGVDYIRTKPDRSKRDNLLSLPRF